MISQRQKWSRSRSMFSFPMLVLALGLCLSGTAIAHAAEQPEATCDVDALCLFGTRFELTLTATDPRTGATAGGQPIRQSDLFGYFSLPGLTNNPGNPEVFVKILDGGPVNGHFWVFYGGLTDFELDLVVTDRSDGTTKSYHKDGGDYCGGADTNAFVSAVGKRLGGEAVAIEVPFIASNPEEACDDDRLCLLGNRYELTLAATDPRTGKTGQGIAIAQTDAFGYFGIPDLTYNPGNPEVFVKMLDRRAIDGKVWLFHGGLTDFEYTLTVRDVVSEELRQYTKEGFTFCGGSDLTLEPPPGVPPTLTSVEPDRGAITGGFNVILRGTGFEDGRTSVAVDGLTCTSLIVIDEVRLTCTMPPHEVGVAQIVATTPSGTSNEIPFTYEDESLTTLIVGPDRVTGGDRVQLVGIVPADSTVEYRWVQAAGQPVDLVGADQAQVSFVAPVVGISQTLEFTLRAEAGGRFGRMTTDVTVYPDTVTVDAGADIKVEAGSNVSLHAVGRVGFGEVKYAWQQVTGPDVSLRNATTPNPTFTAPDRAATLEFEVMAYDEAGIAASDRVRVEVTLPPAPVLTSGATVTGFSGETLSLQTLVAGGFPLGATVQWTQVSGPTVTLQGADTLTPTFTAPTVQKAEDVEFRVTLLTSFGQGAVTYVTARVNPRPDTSPLHVDAGKDQSAESGDTIQLHVNVLSSVTQPTYQWRQVSGRAATLAGADAHSVTVQLPKIPDVPDNQSDRLLFEVTVTDQARQGVDQVEVDLFKLRVSAELTDLAVLQRGSFYTGETAHLASNVRFGKAPLTVSWIQTAGPPATVVDPDKQNASVLLGLRGDYAFSVTVTDVLGNQATQTVSASAVDRPAPPVVVPPPTSSLAVNVTGGSTKALNPTYEGDVDIAARVSYSGQVATPTISWQQTAGPAVILTPVGDGTTVMFDAPLVTSDTNVTLQATVDDGVRTVTVSVDYLIQDRPVHVALDSVPDSYAGKSTTLTARARGGSGALTYQWTQVGNGAAPVTLSDADATVAHFTAPVAGTYLFAFTARDGLNNEDTGRVTALIDAVPVPPTPSSSTIDILFPPPLDFVEGEQSQYVAAISGLPTGAKVTWAETLGNVAVSLQPDPSDPRQVDLTFPGVPADTTFQLKVTVTDAGGAVLKEASSPSLVIRDRKVSVAAQLSGASAGIRPGDTVHLGATASGTFGNIRYQWAVTSGSGTLGQSDTANPTFVPSAGGTAQLTVTVTDDLGNTANASVSVTSDFLPIVFTPPAAVNRDWPADANASPITLSVLPTGGSGQFRLDYALKVYEFGSTNPDYEDNDGLPHPLALDLSNRSNPVVALTAVYFGGSNIGECEGLPCKRVKARLVITVTDTQSGRTASGTTDIVWGAFSKAQQALVSTPPSGPSCSGQGLDDRRSAFDAAAAAGAKVYQYTCLGPAPLCEKLLGPEESPDGQRIYGILIIDNRSDATRVVERKFGTLAEATNGWFNKYSSNDRCTRFDFNFVYTNDIYCEIAYAVPFGNGSPSEGGACSVAADKSNGPYKP